MKFIPAPLTDSIEELERQLELFSPHFRTIAIDIVDKNFNPTPTYQIQDLISFSSIWITDNIKNIQLDFDLMVYDWENCLDQLAELSKQVMVHNVFLHSQTLTNKPYPIDNNFPFSIGLAIDPEDEIEDLARHINLNMVKAIQIMTVKSGAQGQALDTKLLNKIGTLRSNNYSNNIYVDGGINEQTLQAIFSQKYLPDFVCIGSYLSRAGDDLQRRIDYLKAKEE